MWFTIFYTFRLHHNYSPSFLAGAAAASVAGAGLRLALFGLLLRLNLSPLLLPRKSVVGFGGVIWLFKPFLKISPRLIQTFTPIKP
jgi:hypothetical protein